MIEEARILLEAAAVALEDPHADIEAIRDMIRQADELLARADIRPSAN
jgi:hypothetical protein